MSLYSKRLNCRRRCIGVGVILCFLSGMFLQLQSISLTLQRNEALFLKRDISNVSGLIIKNRPTEYNENDLTENLYDSESEKQSRFFNSPYPKDDSTVYSANQDNNLKQTELFSIKQEETDESKVVFFIGGQKCGSTTLATYLKHDPNDWTVWDVNGQFMDGGKEFCWSKSNMSKERFWKHFKKQGSKTAIFALDACPNAIERSHLLRMVQTFPNASYLMLVRDPVDRVISDLNAAIETGRSNTRNLDDLLKIKTKFPGDRLLRLSMFGNILQTAYSVLPKSKILIIPTTNLKTQPQETVDKVMKHIGANPKRVTLTETNKRKDKSTYQIPSNETIEWLRNIFHNDWILFKNISGINVDNVYM